MIKVNSELLINTLRAVFFLIENSENRSYLMLTFILIYTGLNRVIGAKGITIQLPNNDVSGQLVCCRAETHNKVFVLFHFIWTCAHCASFFLKALTLFGI